MSFGSWGGAPPPFIDPTHPLGGVSGGFRPQVANMPLGVAKVGKSRNMLVLETIISACATNTPMAPPRPNRHAQGGLSAPLESV